MKVTSKRVFVKVSVLSALIMFFVFSANAQDRVIAPIADNIPTITAPAGYSSYFGDEITIRASINEDGSVASIDSVEGPQNVCSGVEIAEATEVRQLAEKMLNDVRFTPAQQGGRNVEGKVVLRLKIAIANAVAPGRNANVPESKESGESNGKFSPGAATISGNVVAEPQGPPIEPISSPVPKSVSGGILNSKAIFFPKPVYPAAAKAVRAGGVVNVQILVSEDGQVISAAVVSGHPSLREASRTAACGAKFSPLKLKGEPVKLTGVITYNFVP